jgi:hypothetical protein
VGQLVNQPLRRDSQYFLPDILRDTKIASTPLSRIRTTQSHSVRAMACHVLLMAFVQLGLPRLF